MRERGNELKKINDNYFSILQETLVGIREIKSIGIIDQINKFYNEASKQGKKKKLELSIIGIKSQASISLINSFQITLNTIMGIYFVLQNSLAMETFIAFSTYSKLLNSSLISLTSYNSELQQVLISLNRIFNLLDNSIYKEELFGDKQFDVIEGKITFENVYFEYKKNKPIEK